MAHNSIIDLITCCKSIDDVNHNIYIHIDKNGKVLMKRIIKGNSQFKGIFIAK